MSKKADFLKIALNEVGYKEKKSDKDLDSKTANAGSGNYTKYGQWYGMNPAPWCAIFISWCADKAGILKKLVPKYAGCGTGYKWFKTRNLITSKPKAGDIGFLKSDLKGEYASSHTFIVYEVNGNVITTIEGNLDGQVKKNTRKITDKTIKGFGSVQYDDEVFKYVDNVDYEGLNVHKGNSIPRVLPIATKVEVVKTSGDKTYISSNEWVYSKYLSDSIPKYKVVKGTDKEGLVVRKSPSIFGKRITIIKGGTKVKVYKTKGNWSKISPDHEAWSYSKYLK